MSTAVPNTREDSTQILVADDDFVFRTKLSLVLSSAGYDVVEATDGAQAWELLSLSENRAAFNMVLTDLRMPKLDGMALIEKIKEAMPEMPLIVFTAFGDKKTMKMAIRLGVKDFYEKPLSDIGEFSERVASLLEETTWDLRHRLTSPNTSKERTRDWSQILTPREKQILRLTLDGLTSAESAELCFISRRTVEVHRANILRKLGVRSTQALFLFAHENGLINPGETA